MEKREILFRGKDSEGKWHEGDYHKNVVLNTVVHVIIFGLGWAEIPPETLGQYTGLKDKNGAKIFEGDVVKHPKASEPEDLGWLVEWAGVEYIFQNVRTKEVCSATNFVQYVNDLEIIGNIHDNPELLTKSE